MGSLTFWNRTNVVSPRKIGDYFRWAVLGQLSHRLCDFSFGLRLSHSLCDFSFGLRLSHSLCDLFRVSVGHKKSPHPEDVAPRKATDTRKGLLQVVRQMFEYTLTRFSLFLPLNDQATNIPIELDQLAVDRKHRFGSLPKPAASGIPGWHDNRMAILNE